MTKLCLGVHSLRIQTGKYENRGAPIPVDGRTCLVCNRGYIEDERHFLMYRPLSRTAETKDFARPTSHPVRGWTGKNKAFCSPGTQNGRRVIKVYCPGYDNIRNELHSLLSTYDVVFKSLNDEGKIRYLLTQENETTSKIVGKYTYLMFQKRKDILNAK